MFSAEQKREIADKVQQILRETNHPELPEGEIQFYLHIKDTKSWAWTKIKNNGSVWSKPLQEYRSRQSGKKLDIPAVGSRWMHAKSGNMYDVIMVANLDATREDYPVTVVYRGKSTGGVWARTIESWHERMRPA